MLTSTILDALPSSVRSIYLVYASCMPAFFVAYVCTCKYYFFSFLFFSFSGGGGDDDPPAGQSSGAAASSDVGSKIIEAFKEPLSMIEYLHSEV